MCSVAAIGQVVGGGMNMYGQMKGGKATAKVYKQAEKNQARLRADNLSAAVAASEKNLPGAAVTPVPTVSSQAEGQALAKDIGGADGQKFSGDIARTVSTGSNRVDEQGRHVAMLRAFGLVDLADQVEKQNAVQKINTNNLEAQNAMALLPSRLRAAGAQGAKWRMAGQAIGGASAGTAGMV